MLICFNLIGELYRWVKTQLHNFVRLNDRDDRGFINANRDSISRRENNSEADSSYEQNLGSLTDPAMVVLRDSIANSIWGDNN